MRAAKGRNHVSKKHWLSAGCALSLIASGGVAHAHAAAGSYERHAQKASYGPERRVIRASGDISQAVKEFQDALGGPLNNNEPQQQRTGRREINWDGVPPNLTNNAHFPGDFFNSFEPGDPPVRKRGATFLAENGGSFEVSDKNFADVDPSYGQQFQAFSAPKTFMVRGSNALEVRFQAVGAPTPALVKGLGVVFSDVDKNGSARIETLGRQWRPPRHRHRPAPQRCQGPLVRGRGVR